MKKIPQQEYDTIPDDIKEKVELDKLIFGNGFVEKDKNGKWKHLPAQDVIINSSSK